MWWPGVPAPGTPDWKLFCMSFWAALYSGFIYSLFVGIVVGLIVWMAQARAEARGARYVAEREVARVRRRLRAFLSRAEEAPISSAVHALPYAAQDAASFLGEQQVDLWRPALPRERSFFDAVDRFEEAFGELREAAWKLDGVLASVIREYRARKGGHVVSSTDCHTYFMGRILGREDAVRKFKDSVVGLEDDYNGLRVQPAVAEATQAYLGTRARVEEHVRELQQALDTPPGRKEGTERGKSRAK